MGVVVICLHVLRPGDARENGADSLFLTQYTGGVGPLVSVPSSACMHAIPTNPRYRVPESWSTSVTQPNLTRGGCGKLFQFAPSPPGSVLLAHHLAQFNCKAWILETAESGVPDFLPECGGDPRYAVLILPLATDVYR
jgi:hypothetical protein